MLYVVGGDNIIIDKPDSLATPQPSLTALLESQPASTIIRV